MAAAKRGAAAARRGVAAGKRCAAAACLVGAAVLGGGCGDSASPGPDVPGVVSVLGQGSERATGFIIAPGRVVTVAHALPADARVRVQADRGDARSARVLARDSRTDLALLGVPRLHGGALETATTGNEDRVRVVVVRGGRAVTIAAAVRRAIDAHVSAPGAERALSRPALELDARIRAGDSGAPVITEGGEVSGVVFARSRNHADTAYAVDAQALVEFLYRNGGETRRAAPSP